VLENADLYHKAGQIDASVVAIGDNNVKLEKLQRLSKNHIDIATVMHLNSIVSKYSEIGKGTVVFVEEKYDVRKVNAVILKAMGLL